MNTGLILFLVFILCLVIGISVSVSLSMVSLTAVVFGGFPASSTAIAQRVFGGLQSSSIMVIAFFALVGDLMTRGRISRRIVDFANCLVGNARGGISLALVLACIFPTALPGSAPATVTVIGTMLYGDTIKKDCSEPRTAGLLVMSGGPESIIPSFIIMVTYCISAGASVGDMLRQGMMVGIVIMLVLMVEVLWFAYKGKWPRQNVKRTPAEVMKVSLDTIPTLPTPVTILGGIYSSILTAMGSAAVAVVQATITGAFIYHELNLPDAIQAIKDSVKSSAMILFIIAASTAFLQVSTILDMSKVLVDMAIGMNLSAAMFCLVVTVILLIFGISMEGIAIAVSSVPVPQPIVQSMGINVVHLGIIVCASGVVGTMTPPVTVDIYPVATVSRLKMREIAKAKILLLVGYVKIFFLCVFSEQFCTFLT